MKRYSLLTTLALAGAVSLFGVAPSFAQPDNAAGAKDKAAEARDQAGKQAAEAGKKPADAGKQAADAGKKPADAGKQAAEAGKKPADAGKQAADAGKGKGKETAAAKRAAALDKQAEQLEQVHARRVAQLARIAEIGRENGNDELVARASTMLEKENQRYQRQVGNVKKHRSQIEAEAASELDQIEQAIDSESGE